MPAIDRATAVNPTDLPKQQAAVAYWLSKKYRVAPEPLGALVAGVVPRLGAHDGACPGGCDRALDDTESLQVIASLIKQRRDSIEQFTRGGREDLASKEAAEMAVLEAYLPPAIGEAEIAAAIDAAIAETGATGARDMGKVMKAVNTALAGQTIDSIVMHGYAALASSMQRFFRDAGAVKKQNRVFGGLLMGVGAALFFVKRGGATT